MFGSLFDFAKDVGAKLFTSDEEAAENILAHIQENNPGVDPIQVAYDDGCVTLTGTASDDAAKEKCVLIAGNVEGVEKVVADDLVVPPPPPPGLPSEILERRPDIVGFRNLRRDLIP